LTKKKVEEDGIEISPEEASAVLQKQRTERIQVVEQGIQALCQANNCVLDVQMTFSMYGKPEGRIVVIPRD